MKKSISSLPTALETIRLIPKIETVIKFTSAITISSSKSTLEKSHQIKSNVISKSWKRKEWSLKRKESLMKTSLKKSQRMSSRSSTFLLNKHRKVRTSTISGKKVRRWPNQKTNLKSSSRIQKTRSQRQCVSSILLIFWSNQTTNASTQWLNSSSTLKSWNWISRTKKLDREERPENPVNQYHMTKSTLQSQMIVCTLSKWEIQWTLGLS